MFILKLLILHPILMRIARWINKDYDKSVGFPIG